MPSFNSVSGRFDLVSMMSSMAADTAVPAVRTPVAKAMAAVTENHTFANAKRVTAQLFAPDDSNPNAFRNRVIASYQG